MYLHKKKTPPFYKPDDGPIGVETCRLVDSCRNINCTTLLCNDSITKSFITYVTNFVPMAQFTAVIISPICVKGATGNFLTCLSITLEKCNMLRCTDLGHDCGKS